MQLQHFMISALFNAMGPGGWYTVAEADASSVCTGLGGDTRLATKAEIIDAHNKGYSCCVWGWVRDGGSMVRVMSLRAACGAYNGLVYGSSIPTNVLCIGITAGMFSS